MTGTRRSLGLVPPFLAGLAAAVTVEVSTGLLLYADEGLLPALTLILTIEMGALGMGLWTGPFTVGGGIVEQIRRRWLFCLIAFAMGAVLSAGLSFREDLSGTGIGQGVGLGFLGGLPLFSIGALLGAMSRADDFGEPSPLRIGTASVLGAAAGFFLAGILLVPNAAPYTLYLFSLVLLSGGALLQGWVLDGRPEAEVLEVVPGPTGDLRVETRALGSPRRELKVLLEGGRLRGAEDLDGNPARPWEGAVLEGARRLAEDSLSVLILGGGSGTLARLLSERFPELRLQLVERSRALVMLARSHFFEWEGWESVDLEIGDPFPPSWAPTSPVSMVVVDSGALPTLGEAPFLAESDWALLNEAVAEAGILVLGGLRAHPDGVGEPLFELIRSGRQRFPSASLFRETYISPEGRLIRGSGGGSEAFLLFSRTGAASWPESISHFRLVPTGVE